jgi:hypothetical protein
MICKKVGEEYSLAKCIYSRLLTPATLVQTRWTRTLEPPNRIAAAEIEIDLGETGSQLIGASDIA